MQKKWKPKDSWMQKCFSSGRYQSCCHQWNQQFALNLILHRPLWGHRTLSACRYIEMSICFSWYKLLKRKNQSLVEIRSCELTRAILSFQVLRSGVFSAGRWFLPPRISFSQGCRNSSQLLFSLNWLRMKKIKHSGKKIREETKKGEEKNLHLKEKLKLFRTK